MSKNNILGLLILSISIFAIAVFPYLIPLVPLSGFIALVVLFACIIFLSFFFGCECGYEDKEK